MTYTPKAFESQKVFNIEGQYSRISVVRLGKDTVDGQIYVCFATVDLAVVAPFSNDNDGAALSMIVGDYIDNLDASEFGDWTEIQKVLKNPFRLELPHGSPPWSYIGNDYFDDYIRASLAEQANHVSFETWQSQVAFEVASAKMLGSWKWVSGPRDIWQAWLTAFRAVS